MASYLTLTFEHIKEEVGYIMGWGRDSSAWSADQLTEIENAIKRGLRMFHKPPRLPGEKTIHLWRFLYPVTTISPIPVAASGTDGIVTSSTVLTATAVSDWTDLGLSAAELIADYQVVITSGTGDITNGTYAITAAAAGDLTIVDHGGTNLDTCTYSVNKIKAGDYDLPADFGAIDGLFTYAPTTMYPPVRSVGEGQIRQMRQARSAAGRPGLAAIRPKVFDLDVGQRFEVIFYPAPSATYVMTYRYRAMEPALDSGETFPEDNNFPLGGIDHADTCLNACRAIAEMEGEGEKGPVWEEFMQSLDSSIALERQSTPETFGYNGDSSDKSSLHPARATLVTYNNIEYGS